MDQASALRSTLAGFLGISADALTPDFSLGATKLNSSIQRAMLYAQLRSQAGLSVRGMPAFRTFGELEAQLLNGQASAAGALAGGRGASERYSAAGGAGGTESSAERPMIRDADPTPGISSHNDSPISCGIDIESVAALPVASDYWEHDFYKSHFTREEIAYCLLQNKPAVHLAGRWCVKEALKKCDAKFLPVAMNEIEVRQDAGGAPAIWDLTNGGKRRLPHAVSLSHTDDFAVGTVVRLSPSALASSSPSVSTSNLTPPAQPSPNPKRQSNRLAVAGVLIGLLAIALALYSMWRPH